MSNDAAHPWAASHAVKKERKLFGWKGDEEVP